MSDNQDKLFRIWNITSRLYMNPEDYVIDCYGKAKPKDASIINQFSGDTLKVERLLKNARDSNQEPLYDGDIVRDDEGCFVDNIPRIDIVITDDYRTWLKYESFGWEGEELQFPGNCVKIGNVNENPEVLPLDFPYRETYLKRLDNGETE